MGTMPDPARRSLHVHPVKSVAGLRPGEAVVEPWGLAGDRRWVLVDAPGKVVTQRQQPRLALAAAEPLPDGGIRLSAPGQEPLTVAVPEPRDTVGRGDLRGTRSRRCPPRGRADAWFSAYLGAEVRLVHLDDPATGAPSTRSTRCPARPSHFADGYPLLLTTLASLDALNSLIAQGDHADEGPLPMNRFRPNVVVAGTAPWAEDDWRASPSARSPSGWPSPAAAASSPRPTSAPPSAARSPCTRWPGTAASGTSWSSGRTWCRSVRRTIRVGRPGQRSRRASPATTEPVCDPVAGTPRGDTTRWTSRVTVASSS